MLISQESKIAAKVRFFPHIRKKKTIYFSSAGEECVLCGQKKRLQRRLFLVQNGQISRLVRFFFAENLAIPIICCTFAEKFKLS